MLIDTRELESLVEFEQSVKNIDIEKPIQIKFVNGKIQLTTHDGIKLYGAIDRPLIHQIGGRAWGIDLGFKKINEKWENKYKSNLAELEYDLASAFRKNELSIRYYTDRKGYNHIYGIVTPYFLDVNQFDFRQTFLEAIKENSYIKPISLGITKNKKTGQVFETFMFNNNGFQTDYEYHLNYAKNNGYSAYNINWGREVLICSNGLTEWRGENSQWRHTKKIELSNFISTTVAEGVGNQEFLEKRIETLKDTPLKTSSFNELMERLSLARASKDRIIERLSIDSNDVGNNEWALSQTLTWLATHERALPFSVKPQLTDLGTKILEVSLDTLLMKQPRTDGRGRYGLILPRETELLA